MHHPLSLSLLVVSFLFIFGFSTASQASSSDDVSILINEVARANNQSLLWGPYKPNLYFGVRPRHPKSLFAGLMWAKVDDFRTVQENFRHTCEQHEGMAGYGWDEYDVRKGGRQTIHDAGNTVDITIDFIKVPGGLHGGSWGARVKGVPREDAPAQQFTTVVFYAGLEGLGNLQVENEPDTLGLEGDVKLKGYTPDLGSFTIDVTTGPESNEHPQHSHPSYAEKPLDRTLVTSLQLPSEHLWQTRPLLFTVMKPEVDAIFQKYGTESPPPPPQVFTIPNKPGEGNLHFVQKVFEGAFEFDILFSSGSAPQPITSESLTEGIKSTALSFSDRFEKIFAPQAPFDSPEYTEFSKAMFSNLIGGIGYFYGGGIVDRSAAPEYEEENEGFWEEAAEARARARPEAEEPRELFTCIPSRPFFPRGFLWDEGFHLIPVIDWDMDLALEIVKSWFNLMDEDGWIAREQILGAEARSKVPPEFTVQYPHYANPPTLFMILESFVDRFNKSAAPRIDLDREDIADSLRSAHLENRDLAYAYLRSIYPLLKRHYYWFRKTQRGDIKSYDRDAYSAKEAYRWRGRTVQHILTSGLDDYPRAQPPHPGELHTDLISWMGLASRSLRRIAEALGEKEDTEEFGAHEKAIVRNIDDLHWDEEAQTYCDATIDDYEESVHVCHKGYISIFPFLTGIVGPDSPRLKPILDLIRDPEELWTDYGIRSLSKKDPFYGTAENYWRSPIWMNINYLVLKNLYDIATAPGPHREQARQMYSDLRKNLVQNVFKEWKRTGFAWEQYNPDTGRGQRTQHFTGWTSLVVKMMTMPDLPASKGAGHDEL
ncbi:hypothetical protein VTN96DRAFT_4759 [Rasamsonia emersonii]|uniref:Mannosyl-oligosaccharide glucosidase n=1 Tax=Rasamsonia emersonii (strain ATCC 16479 / CBS 393.64 / IMI 116815) TaxID=1408163 RepID=A0A0F4Z5M2_RASE3|nr:Mannosyl-oligosaccharide glucosidase [Rasamsonia emersonii CBS 393.64]KKA25396.1 Mannosyl-oligosaccharide glucosidase [Rasamsonia emersonii CBS 393.64]